ncbi:MULTISPECIES: GspH/FimT family pseudopilin [Dyella]|nr:MULTISPECIES: GspH/FimT family pseudopilin [Dyella]
MVKVMAGRHSRSHQSGYTVVELMLGIIILSILSVIALPNLRDFMRRNAVIAQSNSLLGDLQYARSEAITRRGLVSVCPRASDAGEAATACATGGSASFDGGWLIYVTPTANTDYNAANAAYQLLRVTSTNGTVSLRASGNTMMTFNARGELTPLADASLSVCTKAGGSSMSNTKVPGKNLTVESSGRAAISNLDGGSCTP